MPATPDLLFFPKPPISPFLPSPFLLQWTGLRYHSIDIPFRHPLHGSFRRRHVPIVATSSPSSFAQSHPFSSPIPQLLQDLISTPPQAPPSTTAFAGRSKKKKDSGSGGRIEGGGDIRREGKARGRLRSRRRAENAFYRRSKQMASGQADSFTEEELEMIGLGYDRSVRFMSGPDDPKLRHPYDWYKYGEFGPYSWRGIVVGPPIRGRLSDNRVTVMGEVQNQEEWESIEQFDMSNQFSNRLNELNGDNLRYYWVFVRHPKWRPSELPWEQWTLAAEVAIEAGGQQRLDKWSLMGRLGNHVRAMITQCAAWVRPDIIYVKRPLYQCRFEPQEDFFRTVGPLLDPEYEGSYLFDQEQDGRVIRTTYFGGLCRIAKVSPKAYVDDVTNAYAKLSDADKSRCLEFLLENHPMELLHPYTKEWKAKLEEMELGCDAADDNDDDSVGDGSQITGSMQDDGEGVDDYDDDYDYDDDDEEEAEDDDEEAFGLAEDEESETAESNPEESEEYWNEQWKKALRSSEEMEKLVKKSMEVSSKFDKQQMQEEEMALNKEMPKTVVVEQEQSREWESARHKNTKGMVKSKIPPELFLRAAVRPFTYRNLVKEIVLMRHAIIDGDIGSEAKPV